MRRVVIASVALAWVVSSAACVSHPVGPARSYSKYEGKAVTTAESALSSVETVRLATEAASKQHVFGPYLSVLISESEEAATGVQGTFASIQPPNGGADRLRGELNDLLSEVVDSLAEVRIAVRRGRIGGLDEVASDLGELSDALNKFIEEHQ
jgi:hypothetical protein